MLLVDVCKKKGKMTFTKNIIFKSKSFKDDPDVQTFKLEMSIF